MYEMVQSNSLKAMLNVFGPNVSTVRIPTPPFKLTVLTQPIKAEGPDWQRQRKLTATPFNEQKSHLVWMETLSQASDMLQSWLSNDRQGLRCTADDTRQLAINVLAFAGFQKSYPFRGSAKGIAADRPSTYRDSLSIILKNALLIMVLPAKAFQIPGAPSKWSQIGWAITVFREYMLTQLEEERRLIAEGQPGTGTLMSNLVRASDEGTQAVKDYPDAVKSKAVAGPKPLTVDEILGNIFVFNFAGHDTTAISLAYSMLLLVAHSDVQDWIAEELNFHLPNGNSESWKYEDSFPKLKRCLAVLVRSPEDAPFPLMQRYRLIPMQLETLRLYNPLPGVPKYTGREAQFLTVNRQDIHIPEDTLVIPNLMALHTHPRYWGRDSLTWNPFRWIENDHDASSLDLGATLSTEKVLEPEKGTFIAWSDGARNCPGKKFAQVEFVATLAALFRCHRAQPVLNQGENLAQAEKRVLDVVKDSSVELLLQMRNPKSVAVTWSHR